MTRIRCRSCGEAQPPAFFCRRCDAVQLLPQHTDYFTVLGLPPHPAVDTKDLDERYYALSRRLHPDRFSTRSPDELRASVQATALLNAAYRTLRDVESRGRYWLSRAGDDLASDNSRVPPELATYVFEVQDKMAELTAGANGAAAGLRSELAEMQRELAERRARDQATLDGLLRAWPADAGEDDERRTAARRELKTLLSELSYLRTLDRDLRKALED